MTRKSFKMVVTVVLALVMGFAPVGSVLAAEADDIAVTDTDAYTYADDAAESEETVVEHYWDRYGWDETSHLLICNCGVSNCSLAGTDSRGVHSFGDWYTVGEPTETEAGLKTRSCWCGYRQYEAIPALAAEEKPEEKPDDSTSTEDKTEDNKTTEDGKTEDNKVTDDGNKTENNADNNKVTDNNNTEVANQGTNGSESNNNGGSSTKDDSTAATTPTAPATTTPPAPVVIPVPTTVPTTQPTVAPVVNVTTVTNVTVQPSRVNRITINKSKTVKVGKKVKLSAKYAGFSRKNFSWKISNKKRATVTKDGIVKAKKAGRGKTVTVTATAKKYGSTTTTIVKIVYKLKIK